MNPFELMKERHSVRQYQEKQIEPKKRKQLQELVNECNRQSGMHIQILFDEPKCFSSAIAHYGSFRNVNHYIALVGKKSPDLEEQAGYYGEKIVLKAQELGLNTCWVALTHGKSAAKIGKGEKQVVLIALGYGAVNGKAHKNKELSALCDLNADSPDWYRDGMAAVMLAPTAVNQQKFYFSRDGEKVTARVKGIGACTKIDLGIVKYHFEAVTGRKVM